MTTYGIFDRGVLIVTGFGSEYTAQYELDHRRAAGGVWDDEPNGRFTVGRAGPTTNCDGRIGGAPGRCSSDTVRIWCGRTTPAVVCGKHADDGTGHTPKTVFDGHRIRTQIQQGSK